MFQSTHPYRVWRRRYSCMRLPGRVSIHTPIQGVTVGLALVIHCFPVSIHTPIQGVTPQRYFYSGVQKVSIHTPIQGVTWSLCTSYLWGTVSIHTPIQGVTNPEVDYWNVNPSFNPHTHTGCDWINTNDLQYIKSFNPHTHTGCDGLEPITPTKSICFNPHTHTGCDWVSSGPPSTTRSFNPHTHTGCDQRFTIIKQSSCKFQSTHPYRVWLQIAPAILLSVCFNPHTHTGCDKNQPLSVFRLWSFNPHTHTGCDDRSRGNREPSGSFQSTHPYRVWLSRAENNL